MDRSKFIELALKRGLLPELAEPLADTKPSYFRWDEVTDGIANEMISFALLTQEILQSKGLLKAKVN